MGDQDEFFYYQIYFVSCFGICGCFSDTAMSGCINLPGKSLICFCNRDDSLFSGGGNRETMEAEE